MKTGMTLARHLRTRSKREAGVHEGLSELLMQIGQAGKVIAGKVVTAGLENLLGETGTINVQGEVVLKLDQFSNDAFIQAFSQGGLVTTLISEEMEQAFQFEENVKDGKYILLIDPLDGSSNIDVNGIIGSIFSVFRRTKEDSKGTIEDILRKGTEQVVGGYILYGPSTMFVYTAGDGTHAFILDPGMGEFLLSHENIRVPKSGKIYSVNEGNYHSWEQTTRQFIDYLKVKDRATGRPYSARYGGSLVADFHRTLLKGGIFLYPGSVTKPEGKLRLQYEAAPMAFVMEQAGGSASTGQKRILDLKPEMLHERTPLVIGSPDDVSLFEEFSQNKRKFES